MKTRIYDDSERGFFPVYASTASVDFLQPYVNRPEGYGMHQVFMVSAGCGSLQINNETYFLEENDLFYIMADVPHIYYPEDDAFSTTYISFSGDGFGKIKEYFGLGSYGVFKQKGKGVFYASTQKLYEAFDAACEVSRLCSLTFSAVIAFFDEALKKQLTPIEQVYNYLESNYHKVITLDDILTIYPYSKAKLCKDFKNKYSVTVFEFLTQLRLRHARHMIEENPYLKLKTIASLCGFNDVSYFCKMYKKAYMHSPKTKSEYDNLQNV